MPKFKHYANFILSLNGNDKPFTLKITNQILQFSILKSKVTVCRLKTQINKKNTKEIDCIVLFLMRLQYLISFN